MKNTSIQAKQKSLLKTSMNKYNFDDITKRKGTDSIKYSDCQPNLLPMWVADMDFKVLPEITDSIKRKADIPSYGYVDVPKAYFESYIGWFKRHHGFEIDIDKCIFSTGVIAALDSIFKHILKANDGVMMQTPIYHTFFHCLDNNNLDLVDNQLIYKNSEYSIDWAGFENSIKSGSVKVFLLCNPHNPTGKSYNKSDLNRFAKTCFENNVLLISDEVHGDICKPGCKYTSILEVDNKYKDNVIALLSPSKAFNVAGIHAAMVVVNNEKLKDRIQDGLWADDVGEPNYFACDATIAAYNNGDVWNQEMCEYVQKNKDYVNEFFKINLPKIKIVKSDFLYLMWMDISSYSNDSEDFAKRLKEETGIWVSEGSIFKGNGKHFIRVNVATSYSNIKDFCNRFLKFIKDKTASD